MTHCLEASVDSIPLLSISPLYGTSLNFFFFLANGTSLNLTVYTCTKAKKHAIVCFYFPFLCMHLHSSLWLAESRMTAV